jgi:rfaE bifunctional protein nucleotidyltransferase chain/domain
MPTQPPHPGAATAAAATASKVIPFEAARETLAALRNAGRTIVHSHGVFDLMHPGHILHLEEARALGDMLVVTLTADRFVDKGPGRPYFNEQLRIRSLAALACVDHVILVPHRGPFAAIDVVRPNFYCKGKEYEDPSMDLSGLLRDERAAVESYGGEMKFVGPIKYSSTRLLNHYFDHLSEPVKAFCTGLAAHHTRKDFHDTVESFRNLRVLVVGDTIFDRYAYVKAQGLTSKNLIISSRFLNEDTQCGGALAVFRHVREFVDDVRYFSLVGHEPWVQVQLAAHIPPSANRTVYAENFTTVVKQRFVEPPAPGKEVKKLFSVNYIDATPPAPAVIERVLTRLREEIRQVDAVLLLDFGHGLMQPAVRDLIQDTAPFLALNCQTNSNNHGFNIINRQYRRADAFTLDEQELILACGHRRPDLPVELESLRRHLGAQAGWLTRGAVETRGVNSSGDTSACPPLEFEVVDAIGAGDAFFSVVALAAARGLPLPLTTFLGQLAGAQAVKIIGNSRPISKQTLVQGGMSLLNL